jgi:membrane-associated progesterone receptor component
MQHETEPKSFAPKTPVELAPSKDDPITTEELAKCDGASTNPPKAPGEDL